MKVKQFLRSYNIGRSNIKKAVVLDINTGNGYTYSERELREDAYGSRGNLSLNTFTITEDKIVIYAD